MNRAAYTEDWCDQWVLIRWRGAVAASIRGARGQAFLKELLVSLDAMPVKRLIAHELINGGEVCALGSVGVTRGLAIEKFDPEDYQLLSQKFNIPQSLVREIEYENDMMYLTPEARWIGVRDWVESKIVCIRT